MYNEHGVADDLLDGMVAPFLHRDASDLSRNAISTNTNHTLEIAARHPEISAPTLLLWGIPGSGQHRGYADRLAEEIPNTETILLDRSYHWVMEERPTAYAECLGELVE